MTGCGSSIPAGFLVWNRGKESVVADLRTDVGQRQRPRRSRPTPTSSSRRSAPTWPRRGASGRAVACPSTRGLVYCSIRASAPRGAYAALARRTKGVVAAKAGMDLGGVRVPRADRSSTTPRSASVGAGHMADRGHARRARRAGAHGPRPGRRGDARPGVQPARLLRHHDVAARPAHHGRRAGSTIGDRRR